MAYKRKDHEGVIAKERRSVAHRVRIAVGGFFCVACIVACIAITTSEKMYIQNIQISGTHFADDGAVYDEVQKHLDRMILGIIPRWNIVFVGKQKLKNTLMEVFPIIEKISIQSINQTLILHIDERAIAYTWCEQIVSDEVVPRCAYMDTVGILFAEAPYFSQSAKIVFYTPFVPLGEVAVPADIVRSVHVYEKILSEVRFTVRTIRIENDDVHIEGIFGGMHTVSDIIVKPDAIPEDVVAYIKVLMTDSDFSKLRATHPLRYIDARFGKILYYRFDI